MKAKWLGQPGNENVPVGMKSPKKKCVNVWIFFESHAKDKKVWGLRVGNTWYRTKNIHVFGSFRTRYRGAKGKQPKAYLYGQAECVLRHAKRDEIVVVGGDWNFFDFNSRARVPFHF
jgi:hypothetical protein